MWMQTSRSQLMPHHMGWEQFCCKETAIHGDQLYILLVQWQILGAIMLKWRRKEALAITWSCENFKLQEIHYRNWPQAVNRTFWQQKPTQSSPENHEVSPPISSLRIWHLSCAREASYNSRCIITDSIIINISRHLLQEDAEYVMEACIANLPAI